VRRKIHYWPQEAQNSQWENGCTLERARPGTQRTSQCQLVWMIIWSSFGEALTVKGNAGEVF
jgi:hypothetical protein